MLKQPSNAMRRISYSELFILLVRNNHLVPQGEGGREVSVGRAVVEWVRMPWPIGNCHRHMGHTESDRLFPQMIGLTKALSLVR